MLDGTLSVRRRDPKPSETLAQDQMNQSLSTGAYEYFTDMEQIFGKGYIKPRKSELGPVVGPADEFKVETKRVARLKEFDKALKRFKYGAALDAGMKKVCLRVLVSMIASLASRQGADNSTIDC